MVHTFHDEKVFFVDYKSDNDLFMYIVNGFLLK